MPARDGQLGREDGGASLIAVLGDFPEVATFHFAQRRHGPVVDDQNIDAPQSSQQMAQASIGSSQGQVARQASGTKIEGRVAITTSFLGQSGGQEALAYAARSD